MVGSLGSGFASDVGSAVEGGVGCSGEGVFSMVVSFTSQMMFRNRTESIGCQRIL